MFNHLSKAKPAIKQFGSRYHSTIEPLTKHFVVEDQKFGTREIAYKKYVGKKDSNVIYIPGFMSNMSGIKATTLSTFCQKHKFTYTRYDPTGLGESRPISLADARLSHWIQDAERALKLVDGPQVVVGSSMGGWISLLLCQKYPDKFKGLVLIAPGINFTKRYTEQISSILPKAVIEKLEKGETFFFEHPEYGTFPISFNLTKDMYQHELDLSQGLDVHCPVRIIQGMRDDDVPYTESMDILQSLKSEDVELTYVKNGDHRLSTDENLNLICDKILNLT